MEGRKKGTFSETTITSPLRYWPGDDCLTKHKRRQRSWRAFYECPLPQQCCFHPPFPLNSLLPLPEWLSHTVRGATELCKRHRLFNNKCNKVIWVKSWIIRCLTSEKTSVINRARVDILVPLLVFVPAVKPHISLPLFKPVTVHQVPAGRDRQGYISSDKATVVNGDTSRVTLLVCMDIVTTGKSACH